MKLLIYEKYKENKKFEGKNFYFFYYWKWNDDVILIFMKFK